MYTKPTAIALCATLFLQAVVAGHINRHMHPKREIVWAVTDTVLVTDYVTVTVTQGQELTALAIPSVGEGSKGKRPGHFPHHPLSSASDSFPVAALPVSTSSADPVEPNLPVPTATTLVTLVKPSPSVVEPPAAPSVTESPVEVPAPAPVPTTQLEVPAPAPAPTTQLEVPAPAPIPTTQVEAPAPTTQVEAPAPTEDPAPPVSSGKSKRGAAYNDASLVKTILDQGADLSWGYNWGSSSSGLDSRLTYYPLLWSPASEHSHDWNSKADAGLEAGADCLLSFNEPDISSQAAMTPQDAAAGHIQWMNPYADKARISAPSISSSQNANQGIDWLGQFFDACDGKCQIDFCNAHWYGPGGQDGADLFLEHVKNVHSACDNKPVWITEFAAEGGDTDTFMTAITTALDSVEFSFVEKYSYFMVSQGSLLQSPTALSSFGKIFAGLS